MPDNRARIWFALFVLLVFCSGGAIGFRIGTQMPPGGRDGRPGLFSGRGPGRGGPFGRGPLGPPPLPPDLVNRLSRELALDANQQAQLTKVLEERRERLEQVHRDARDRFDKEQQELHAAIRALLRPDQQEKFKQFLDRRPPPERRPQ